jgi:hypothetical protein
MLNARKDLPNVGAEDSVAEDSLSLLVQVHIAEFNQLREEINVYHNHQKEEIYFAMISLGGVFATLLAKDLMSSFPEVFLVFPFVFVSLAFAYADRTIRILRIATYLHQNLRENLVNELGTRDLLQWEVFKKYRVFRRKEDLESSRPGCLQGKISLRFRRRLPELPLVLDIGRVAQFVMPSLLCIYLFVIGYHGPWDIFKISAVATVTIIALSPIYLFAKSEETSGISMVPVGERLTKWEERQIGELPHDSR